MNTSIDREVTLANWMNAPWNRVAFQRVRELVPTALIRNRSGNVAALPRAERPLGTISVPRADGRRSTFGEQLAESCCDAICVVHRGTVVFERRDNSGAADTLHLLMSVTKSVCATTLGIAVGRGHVATSDLVCDVAPEFTGTSLDGATVQHVIDMTAGTDFVEDYALYADPTGDSPLIDYERHAGYRPLGDRPPLGVLGHFRGYGVAFEHGERFQYRSPLTNVAARLVEIVNGMRFADVVSRDLWGPLGMEHDADIMLDPLGFPVAEGGMSCSVRDLARFGMAFLGDGSVAGASIVPADWVADTIEANDDAVRAYRAGDGAADRDEWSHYRNAWWVIERGRVLSGLGIFGQYCYVDRPSQTVIARFSTFPEAFSQARTAETLGAFRTVCEELGS